MRKCLFLYLFFIAFFMLGCKTNDATIDNNNNYGKDEETYTISIHYTLNEREDKVITFNSPDIVLEDLEVEGYIFLGYFEGNKKIEKIELRDYNLETRYDEIKEIEYHITISYIGIEKETDDIIFTASTINNIRLERLDNDKVFLGFFEGDKELYEITELRNYVLEAIYIDERAVELFFKFTEIGNGEYSKYENCKSFFGNTLLVSCTLEADSYGYIENYQRDELFSINEVNNSQYSYSENYDYYHCFYLISNRILEDNKIIGANCDYLSKIKVIPNIKDEYKKEGKKEYYKEIVLNLPLGDIVQFEKIGLDFERFEGENIYNIDNNTIIKEYNLDRYVLFINHDKLEKYIQDELNKITISENYTYFDLYKEVSLDTLFEFQTYVSEEEKGTFELLYYFIYR